MVTHASRVRKPDVLCVGIAVVDVMGRPIEEPPAWDHLGIVEELEQHCGGCALNTATDLARLGDDVGVCCMVGDDTNGQFIVSRLDGEGVFTQGVLKRPGANTSYTFVMINSQGRRSYLHHIGANALFTDTDVSDELLDGIKILHLGGSLLMNAMDGEPSARLLKKARARGIMTVMDTAYNPKVNAVELIRPCLEHLDIFIPSIEEAQLLFGNREPEAMLACLDKYPIRLAGIKLGSEGCLLREGGKTVQVAPCRVEVVDASGAGDSFMAGIIHGQLHGWDLEKSGRFAAATAACCIQAVGCSTGIRSSEQVLKLMEQSQAECNLLSE